MDTTEELEVRQEPDAFDPDQALAHARSVTPEKASKPSDNPDFETADDPRIPSEKQFFKIGEVAEITQIKPYVLRYWESEFAALRPTKTSARQRLYRRQDVATILKIKRLRYEENHTIASAKEEIKKSKKSSRRSSRRLGSGLPQPAEPAVSPQLGLGFQQVPRSAELVRRLKDVREQVLDLMDVVKE